MRKNNLSILQNNIKKQKDIKAALRTDFESQTKIQIKQLQNKISLLKINIIDIIDIIEKKIEYKDLVNIKFTPGLVFIGFIFICAGLPLYITG